jgi:transcriptional regulator with XRE-family HTH domain
VPGPRREEVASLAGVSFDYYARLERGNLSGVSASVLEARLDGVLVRDDLPFNLARFVFLDPYAKAFPALGHRCPGHGRCPAHPGRP